MPHNISSSLDRESSVREMVIDLLSEEFPLTTKRIFNIINKKYGKSVSYQAVYKAVHELLDKGIVSRKGREYYLAGDYIERLGNFVDAIKLNYRKRGGLEAMSGRDFFIKKLGSQYEMALFIIDVLKAAGKGDIITLVWPVVWPGLETPEIYEPLKDIGKRARVYCVCNGNGFLDRHFAGYWRSLGMNLKLGVKAESMFELFVLRDLVMLVYQPSDVRVRKHKYITMLKGLTALERDKMFLKTIKQKTEIYAFIIRNPVLAERMKQEILGHF